VEQQAEYPELIGMTEEDLFIEGGWMFKGEMPHEEVSYVRLKRMIKKWEKNTLIKQLKVSYGVNRIDFRSIEK